MALKNAVDYLAQKNRHERDSRISFEESTHTYTIDGEIYKTSVSGILHGFFPTFNAKDVIEKNFNKWKEDKKSPYHRFIQYCNLRMHLEEEDIKSELAKMWNQYGNERADYGTGVHLSIELQLNLAPRDDRSPEMEQFEAWMRDAKPKSWEPYRTEWSVFCDESRTAGQIDGLFIDTSDGSFHMVDWKVVEKLEQKHSFGERGFPPFEALHNTNLGHYYVQQNLYFWLLKNRYGITCKSMRLLQLHYTLSEAVEWEIPLLQREVDMVMRARCQDVVAASSKRHKAFVGSLEDVALNEKRIEYYKRLISSIEKDNAKIKAAHAI